MRVPRRCEAAPHVYELAFRQVEVSDTRVFDRPAAGRRVTAVLSSLVGFCHLLDGFTNRQLVKRVQGLRHEP